MKKMLTIAQFTYCKETNTLVAELSDFDFGCRPVEVKIKSHVTGKVVRFHHAYNDMSSDGEEICGYNYISMDPNVKTKLLLIND